MDEQENTSQSIKNLFNDVAPRVLGEAQVDDTQLLTLTREELHELLPGLHNFQTRRNILDLIHQHRQRKMSEEVLCVPTSDTCIQKHLKSVETRAKSPLPSQSISQGGRVKVHLLVCGNTLGAHGELLSMLRVELEESSVEDCHMVVLFCPVVSRAGTDIDAAVKMAPRHKEVILVVIHYTFNPDFVPSRMPLTLPGNVVETVSVLFFQQTGILKCALNTEAVRRLRLRLTSAVPLH